MLAAVEAAAPRQPRPEDGVFEDGGIGGYVVVRSGHGVGSGDRVSGYLSRRISFPGGERKRSGRYHERSVRLRAERRTLSAPEDLGIIGGASAFNGIALAVARYECRTQAVMEVNMPKPPNAGAQCSLDLRRVRRPVQFANPEMTP